MAKLESDENLPKVIMLKVGNPYFKVANQCSVVSCPVVSCSVVSCPVVSCSVVSCPVDTFHLKQ